MSSSYNRKDHLYNLAKEEGYRSRAAYKLKEIDEAYKLIKPGLKIFDVGAWPGGWLQVVSETMGPSGIAVGIDLVQIEEFADTRVKLIKGDARDEASLDQALACINSERTGVRQKFDLLISDMSPKLTGIKEADHIASVACAELALWVANETLRPGGNFVVKVFKSGETDTFFRNSRKSFEKLVRTELKSTRKTSNEFYIIGLGFIPGV